MMPVSGFDAVQAEDGQCLAALPADHDKVQAQPGSPPPSMPNRRNSLFTL